jgi:hypothetical protein
MVFPVGHRDSAEHDVPLLIRVRELASEPVARDKAVRIGSCQPDGRRIRPGHPAE